MIRVPRYMSATMPAARPLSYTDLDIVITPGDDEVCDVAMKSATGRVRSTFVSPVPAAGVVEAMEALESSVVGSANRSLAGSATAESSDPVGLGKALYANLFGDKAQSLLEETHQHARERGEGLRIGLHIRGTSTSSAVLGRLPWELMRPDLSGVAPIALQDDLSVVRRVSQEGEARTIATRIPLRVLVVMANPNDVPPLDLQRERTRIEASWARCPGVEVEFLGTATRSELKTTLRNEQFNVLHYMGHADFDARHGKGVLVLEKEDGSSDLVDGTTLGRILREEHSLQLVFLNACETGQGGSGAFQGVAAAMVDAGLPAVLAMQFKVSDEVAITFSTHFYDAITAEYPVDGAVAMGRQGVVDQHEDSFEWATPVLFMRSPDGFLFHFPVLYQHQSLFS